MVQDNVFSTVLDALNTLGIPYMIVGSYASNYWGRPRMTHDADLVVELSIDQVPGLAQRLSDEFYAPDFVIQEATETLTPSICSPPSRSISGFVNRLPMKKAVR